MQRSESNDPIRSPVNPFKSASQNNNKGFKIEDQKPINDYSTSKFSKQYSIDNKQQINLIDNQDSKKKSIRKLSNKHNNDINRDLLKTTTILPTSGQNRYKDNIVTQNPTNSVTSPFTIQNKFNGQKFTQFVSTVRPLINVTSSIKSVNDAFNTLNNYITTSPSNMLDNFNRHTKHYVTPKSTNFVSTLSGDSQNQFQSNNFSMIKNKKIFLQSHDNQEKTQDVKGVRNDFNKNNIKISNHENENLPEKTNRSSLYATIPSTNINEFKVKTNLNSDDNRLLKKLSDFNVNVISATTYTPTTYDSTKKNHNKKENNDKLIISTPNYSQLINIDINKSLKKESYFKDYQNFETTTKKNVLGKSVELGFSPSSINYLAENFKVTPTIR